MPQTVKEYILNEWVNIVNDFGCVGDGTTDDTTSFQAALDSGNGAVYVPDGTYIVTGLTIPSTTRLFGNGKASIIKLKDSTNASVISNGTQAGAGNVDIIIEKLSIDGNKANNAGDYFGMDFHTVVNSVINNCWTYNCNRSSVKGEGIYITNSTGVKVKKCFSYDNGGVGIKFTNTGGAVFDSSVEDCNSYDNDNDNILFWRALHCSIINSNAYNSGTDGISLKGNGTLGQGCQYCVIIGCRSHDNAEDGIVFSSTCDYNLMNNNTSYNNGEDGLNIYNQGRYNTINGNIVYNNGHHGISLLGHTDGGKGCDWNVVADNIVHDNDSGDTDTYNGIQINRDCLRNVVSGNICTGATQSTGIKIVDVGSTNNKLHGNMVVGNKNFQITDGGTTTKSSDNTVT